MKYTYKEYKQLIDLPLDDKIKWSLNLIESSLKKSKTPAVSLSWGKDSVVMLDLISNFCKGVYVIFANTGVEYPETYKYRDDMLKGYFEWTNYIETKPIKTFWECVELYGYPTIRGKGSSNTPKCCTYLKEMPLKKAEKELGVDLSFIGIQATESMNRRLVFMRVGEYYFNKENQYNRCYPLAIWTDEDVWEYAKRRQIPMNPIYSTMKRNGCMFCTGFKNWREVMVKYKPEIYKLISNRYDEQSILANWECYKK